MTTQNVMAQYETAKKSGDEMTSQLHAVGKPGASEALKRIREGETEATALSMMLTKAVQAGNDARARANGAKKNLRLLNAACSNILAGSAGVVDQISSQDGADDVATARRLEAGMRGVPNFGPGLSKALIHFIHQVPAAVAISTEADSERAQLEAELFAAVMKLQADVAHGKAVLASFGMKVVRKAKKRKVVPATPQPEPVTPKLAA